MELLIATLLVLALAGSPLRAFVIGRPGLSAAGTVFLGVFVQALPFLGLGVVVSGLVAAFVPPDRLARWLPSRPAAAIIAAGVAGAALPGCECGSVPVARRLFGDGVVGAAALTFMLAAPAINPVVLIATAVAFPGQPLRVVARHDFLQAAAYLVLGAAAAAALHVLVPAWIFEHLAGQLLLGIITMALLAVVLALCSEADAFVAASLTMLPLLPRLVFLVVGPAVDLKLCAMQAGMFGRAFAMRFAPVTFVVATVSAPVVGLLLLGGGR